MIAYAVLMWAIAALFLLLGLLIYHGKTGLIHEYHRERVRSEDMAAYGRAFSTGLFALAGTLVLSGIDGGRLLGVLRLVVHAVHVITALCAAGGQREHQHECQQQCH